MPLCNDGEISLSVVLIITTIKRRGCGGGSAMWVLCCQHNNCADSTIPTLHTTTMAHFRIIPKCCPRVCNTNSFETLSGSTQ